MTHKHINIMSTKLAQAGRLWTVVICGMASLLVVGMSACSQKPPGCADQATRDTARTMIVEEATKQLASTGDQDGTLASFLSKSTVELSAITDDGLDKQSNKQLCRAHIKVMPPGADGLEGDVGYSTQRVIDDNSKAFVVNMDNVDQLALALVAPARAVLQARRRIGSYSGRLDCSAVGEERDGPRGPFNVPVTMTLTSPDERPALQALLERSTPAGQDAGVGLGTETLKGVAADRFELTGEGANSAGQRWTTRFNVMFQGETLAGFGEISQDGETKRRCNFNLAKQSVASTGTSSTPAVETAGSVTPSYRGKYVGTGDGTVTVEVGQPSASGSYPVSVATQASTAGGGGCGGSASGDGRASGNALRLAVTDKTLGTTCTVTLTADGKGGLHSEEGDGCSVFHGAACGFSADLARR